MYSDNDRPDRKKSRARVRPSADPSDFDAGTADQSLAPGTSYDPSMAEPLSGYPATATPAAPSTPYPTTGGYSEASTSYPTPDAYAEASAAYPAAGASADPAASHHAFGSATAFAGGANAERRLELREEQLVARKDLREVGEITVRTVIEEVPGRLEVEAQREEVEIEHVPMGQIVTERVGPYEEDGVLVVPIYEEQLVVVKRLMLKEHLRVRRVASTERQLFEDTLRRDRLVIEDPNNTQLVHEQYPTADGEHERDDRQRAEHEETGPLGQLMRKVLG